MIRPNHQCHWSHTRRTEVALGEESVSFAGTSLPVLFDAFRAESLVWYSMAEGEKHGGVQENLWMMATGAALPGSRPYSDISPMQAALGEGVRVSEFCLDAVAGGLLDDATREAFGLGLCGGPIDPALLRYVIRLHDDCFGMVTPAVPAELNGPLLDRLLLSVLRLHSFYLGEEVDWGDVPARIAALLRSLPLDSEYSRPQRVVVLRSDARDKALRIEPSGQERLPIHKRSLLPDLGIIRIRDGRAVWEV